LKINLGRDGLEKQKRAIWVREKFPPKSGGREGAGTKFEKSFVFKKFKSGFCFSHQEKTFFFLTPFKAPKFFKKKGDFGGLDGFFLKKILGIGV